MGYGNTDAASTRLINRIEPVVFARCYVCYEDCADRLDEQDYDESVGWYVHTPSGLLLCGLDCAEHGAFNPDDWAHEPTYQQRAIGARHEPMFANGWLQAEWEARGYEAAFNR